MKKINKSNTFSFLLGAIIFGSLGTVAATSLMANQITYSPNDSTWKVSNVEEAIDDLYSNKSSSAKGISFYLNNQLKSKISDSDNAFFKKIECEKNTISYDDTKFIINYDNMKKHDKCSLYFNSLEEMLKSQNITDIFKDNFYNKQIYNSTNLKTNILFNKNYRKTLVNNSETLNILDANAVKVQTLSNNNNVIYGSQYSGEYTGFKAFDNNNSTRFASPYGGVNGNYIGYDFSKEISVYKVYWLNPGLGENISTLKIQYYDNNEWKDATPVIDSPNKSNNAQNVIYLDDVYTSSKWRLYIVSSTSANYVNLASLQFYGIEK